MLKFVERCWMVATYPMDVPLFPIFIALNICLAIAAWAGGYV